MLACNCISKELRSKWTKAAGRPYETVEGAIKLTDRGTKIDLTEDF
jgi:hypothetical protein